MRHAFCDTVLQARFSAVLLLSRNIFRGRLSRVLQKVNMRKARDTDSSGRSIKRMEFIMFPKSAIIAAFGVFLSTLSADGSDWMFRQSWFSDGATMLYGDSAAEVPPGVTWLPPQSMPNPRSAYRPAIPQRGPGFSIRNKYRFNYYRLNSGQSFDTTIYREFSFEASP